MPTWKQWLKEGDQYYSAAGGHPNKAARFDTTFQYNVIALALESYVMAILDYNNKLPDNHTFTDFIEALQKVVSLDPELREKILQHENIQKICSFTDYTRKEATPGQIADFREAVKKIGTLAHNICEVQATGNG